MTETTAATAEQRRRAVMNSRAPAGPTTGGRHGLTKRESFALAALQGSLASDEPDSPSTPEGHAGYAVRCADALLLELERVEVQS